MKHLILICSTILSASFFSTEVYAQESSKKGQFEIGVLAGLGAPTLISNYSDPSLEPKTQMRLGYHFGVTGNYMLTERFSLRSGVLLNSKGFSEDNPEFGSDDYNRVAMNYIELPLHAIYHIGDRVRVYAGPYASIGLGGDSYGMIGDEKIDQVFYVAESGDVNIADLDADDIPIKKFDFGANFGASYMILKRFSVQAGYSIGLRNINSTIVDPNGDVLRNSDDFKDYHSRFSFSFMYSLPLN